MTTERRREALRGVAEQVLDHIYQVFSREEWAQVLEVPLQRAAYEGDEGLVQKLVEAEAETGIALHKAIVGGHREIVNILLENGASIETAFEGNKPLHVAAEAGDAEIMRSLLRRGADKDELDGLGFTATYSAAQFGHVAGVQALLTAGADINLGCGDNLFLPVHVASQLGNVDVLRALLDHGSGVYAATAVDGCTALHFSANHNRPIAIKVLVEAGANIQAPDDTGATPLHHANSSPDAALALVKHGADTNAATHMGRTPLHYAACKGGRQGTAQVVDVLLRWGADEKAEDDNGRTPADVIGFWAEEQDRLTEDMERVSKLFVNAPADRAWRRRGYLTMCRAHPSRLHPKQQLRTTEAHLMPRTRSRTKLARAEGNAVCGPGGGSTENERIGGDWMEVVVKMVGFEEEGLFRAIMGYL